MKTSVTTALFFSFITGLLSQASFAEIYKTTTADGRVIYTDNVNSAFQYNNDLSKMQILDNLASQTVTDNNSGLSTPVVNQTTNQNTQATTPTSNTTTPSTVQVSKKGDYRLQIIQPTHEFAYRRPQDIVIKVETKPTLNAGDRFVYRINGQHIATTQQSEYSVSSEGYLPEKYQLTVEITNGKGEVINTATQDFYVLANNFIIREQRKAIAEKKAKQEAYDKLPWYKKLTYNITVKD